MNINNIKIKISWSNLNNAISERTVELPVKDIFIKYQDGIVFRGKLKNDIPIVITVDSIVCAKDSIKFHIKDISLLLKFTRGIKDFLIKRFVKGNDDEIIYDDKDQCLIVNKSLIKKFISFNDFKINAIIADKDFVEIELIDIKLGTLEVALTSEILEKDIENHVENHDIKIEDFNEEKAKDYYDKLRDKIEDYIKNKVPERYHNLIPYLLLLPDILMLFIRLLKDNRVSAKDKALVGAAIAYIISPLDIIADIVLPFGVIDDLGVAFFVLDKLILSVPKEVLVDNFNGNERIIDLIKDGYSYVKNIIPANKMGKVLDLFNKILKR